MHSSRLIVNVLNLRSDWLRKRFPTILSGRLAFLTANAWGGETIAERAAGQDVDVDALLDRLAAQVKEGQRLCDAGDTATVKAMLGSMFVAVARLANEVRQ